MKTIGIRKNMDRLGRICIPKEMRELFSLREKVELVILNEGILIKNAETCKK